jgi:alanine racemase
MRGSRVWAEIDLSAVRHNARYVSSVVGRHVGILAVVKADAYGHGAVPVAYAALKAGCCALGVGDSSEALELRDRGILAPIVILGAIIEEEVPRVVENEIEVTIHSKDLLPLLERESARQEKHLGIHLKIDSGMHRLGISPQGAVEVGEAVRDCPHLKLRGISTHLSTVASGNLSYAREQLERFRSTVESLRRRGLIDIETVSIHAGNSAGIFTLPEGRFDMVRTGIALYGSLPATLAGVRPHLRPVLSLKTRIAALKQIPAGSLVGYDQKHRCSDATLIATCPIGYSDGYPYQLTNRGVVAVRGTRAPVVGTVTMDYITVDVTRVPEVRVGDPVTVIGRDGAALITLEEVAELAGTIPYELTCRLGRRVKKVYLDGEAERETQATPDRRTLRWISPDRLRR